MKNKIASLFFCIMELFFRSNNDEKIKIDDFEDFTNSNGYVSAENIELGIQELSISKNNYKNQTREILISPFFKYESTIILENESGQIKNIDFLSGLGNYSGCTCHSIPSL